MTVSSLLDSAGRRRSPATLPGYHGRPSRHQFSNPSQQSRCGRTGISTGYRILPGASASPIRSETGELDDEHSSALRCARRSLRHGEGAVSGASDETIAFRPRRKQSAWVLRRSQCPASRRVA